MDGNKHTVHGPPLQARVVAANRAVLANFTTILAHMAMNKGRGKCKTERGKNVWAAGMAWQRWAGKHSLQNKAVAGKHSRQTIRPAQALKQTAADDPAGTGLAAKQPADEVGRPLAVHCR